MVVCQKGNAYAIFTTPSLFQLFIQIKAQQLMLKKIRLANRSISRLNSLFFSIIYKESFWWLELSHSP